MVSYGEYARRLAAGQRADNRQRNFQFSVKNPVPLYLCASVPLSLNPLKYTMKSISGDYTSLITALDTECARLESLHRKRLNCRPGCITCCRGLSVLPLEAEILGQGLGKLTVQELRLVEKNLRMGNDSCPLLADNLCLLYPLRPIICRTHGLPIAYIDDEAESIEVSACTLNFPEGEELAQEDLLFLDPFNGELFRLNLGHAGISGQDPLRRISIREIIKDFLKRNKRTNEK